MSSGAGPRSCCRAPCDPTAPGPPPQQEPTTPTLEALHKFLKDMYHLCQYTTECNVIALILLIRFLSYQPELKLTPYTWRRFLITALLVAQKFWETPMKSRSLMRSGAVFLYLRWWKWVRNWLAVDPNRVRRPSFLAASSARRR